jgi:HD-like signal output (HDOD) protein
MNQKVPISANGKIAVPPVMPNNVSVTSPPVTKAPVQGNATEQYRRVIESIDNLPSFPAIVSKLITIVNSPDSSADDAAKLIEKDPGLTSKMIRLANSAFYGIPRSISSVSSAVVILGFNTIRSLVLSASVMKMFAGSQKQGLDKERFWRHSIVTALAAKTIVRHFINIRMMDPESAFCAGILHDIGKLIFNEYMNNDYGEVRKFAETKKISLLEAESKLLGINHAEIGRILSDKWSLPLDLEYCLVYHHLPGNADKIMELVATVHFADLLAHELGANLYDGEVPTKEWENVREVLRVTDSDYDKIKQTLSDSIDKSIEFLNIIK